jgi:hypothetical protein
MTPWLIAGGLALLAALYALGRYAKGDPRRIAELARTHGKKAAGGVLLAFCAVMALRGNWMPALILGPIGLGLLKVGPWASGPWVQKSDKATGQRSRVRSAFLDMSLDHDTGDMTGTVVQGAYAGRDLATLGEGELKALALEARADGDSLALLEAYLDRRFPGWREDVERDADPGQRRPGPSQAMTKEEAHEILGLRPGASAEEIRAAHRALMKRLHPDQGGSTWLAAKLNQAKDVLLK